MFTSAKAHLRKISHLRKKEQVSRIRLRDWDSDTVSLSMGHEDVATVRSWNRPLRRPIAGDESLLCVSLVSS